MINVKELLTRLDAEGVECARAANVYRRRLGFPHGEALADTFEGSRCLFWRGKSAGAGMFLTGRFEVTTPDAGGWLLVAQDTQQPSYWIPCLPMQRQVDEHARILRQDACAIRSLRVDEAGMTVGFDAHPDRVLDLVLWEIDPRAATLLAELRTVTGSESQPVFLWGSHGTYQAPSDIYRHLVHGQVFDLRFSWPHKRRSCSENEAHALHLALRSRELSTRKRIYRILRDQILLSVLARQESDGAWRHGIWTAYMECHFRLHCSAMHMLMDCYSERPDPVIAGSLERAAAFITAQAADVRGETWFLHDSLEQSESEIEKNIAGWRRCANPLKAPANTLVLNTHLDTLVALDRCARLGIAKGVDQGHLESARRLLRGLLEDRPAERLYRLFFWPIYLTLLPTERAKALPLPLRILKRLARERLVPLLPALKCRYPRLVMPDGYIDRALSLETLADAYHSINLMDLVRYHRQFPGEPGIRALIDDALRFAHQWFLLEHWAESQRSSYCIGFWIEALFQLALIDRRKELRQALAEAAILALESGLGLPPSVYGANLEVLGLEEQRGCPEPPDPRLRVINLTRGNEREYLLINPTSAEVTFSASPGAFGDVEWFADGERHTSPPPALGPCAWAVAAQIGSADHRSESPQIL